MRKVLLYSLLLVLGLIVSQLIGDVGAKPIAFLTMVALSFIMIHVGYEFEIDRSRPGQYFWDYVVAGTAAAFPWLFCAAYFVLVMAPPELWGHADQWKASLLQARFASPTSAGVLFAMLAAAGLTTTWLFKKARILAIFDDLDTILLMIPLKVMMVGLRWQLVVMVLVVVAMLWVAWRYLHEVRLPVTWPWVLGYAVVISAVSEAIYVGSKIIDDTVPVHLEVLLPAFVLGCMLARPGRGGGAVADGHDDVLETPREKRVATVVSACFMVLVGLSMPPIRGATSEPAAVARSEGVADNGLPQGSQYLKFEGVTPEVLARKERFPGWGMIAVHVVLVTLLSNLGKMFPAFCYRREVSVRQRLALSVGMFPRGEVGAGVLVVSLSYGLAGPALSVAVLCLALNLLATGAFIAVVKWLIATDRPQGRGGCDA